MKTLRLCLMLIAFIFSHPILANATLITFDELPDGTPINGASINIVTFDFSVGGFPSPDATIDGGPGNTPLNTPLNIEGDAVGVLGLNFATPVTSINYAFVLLFSSDVLNGSTITIFDNTSNPIGTASGDAFVPSGFFFPEGTVSIVSAIPIVRAEITFATPFRFAMDNLEFFPTVCTCPPGPKGCISGTVRDGEGKTVILKPLKPNRGEKHRKAVTDSNGCYIFSDLKDGRYRVWVIGQCRPSRQIVKIIGGEKKNDVNFECR